MAVLVLGANGLIGREICLRLVAEGFDVIGLVRSRHGAATTLPTISWRFADIARLRTPQAWTPLLDGMDAIVNASGALQTGLRDDVAAVQNTGMRALFAAAEGSAVRCFVQISASGADPAASTLFMRSKAAADQALEASRLAWVILRPAVVIAPAAYGGSALLRALSAFPFVRPLVYPAAEMRTVPVSAVCDAVTQALKGAIPPGSNMPLCEAGTRSLDEVTVLLRQWLGLSPAPMLAFPPALGGVVAAAADVAGWLGWRSPLRSTALKVMREGVALDAVGDPANDLAFTLAWMPATPQDLWFARLWLLKPLIFVVLFGFWLTSGLVGLAHFDEAKHLLIEGGLSGQAADLLVIAGSLADIILGLMVLLRPASRIALLSMLGVTAAYIAGSIATVPQLWGDPLGPMLKTAPLIGLILVALAILDER